MNKDFNKMVWDTFTTYFRDIMGHEDWTDEQIDYAINNDDIDGFIEKIKEVLNYDYNRDL